MPHAGWEDGTQVVQIEPGQQHEHRVLKRADDKHLTDSKHLWLRRPEDLTAEQRVTFRALQREDLKVGRAWALKERFRTFWAYRYPGPARTFFTRWYWRATHGRLKPIAAVAKLISAICRTCSPTYAIA